jgi:hypothetical protein
MSMKNPVTPPGIDPGTVRLVRRRWEDNIKMNLQGVGLGVWTGLMWLRIGTDSRPL